jgi:hypothetical protein
MPCGAGLCVRRGVAEHYLRLHESGERTFQLDRTGDALLSGGDNDLALRLRHRLGCWTDSFAQAHPFNPTRTLDHGLLGASGRGNSLFLDFAGCKARNQRPGTIRPRARGGFPPNNAAETPPPADFEGRFPRTRSGNAAAHRGRTCSRSGEWAET